MSQRKKPAIRITAFNTSDIVLGTVDGFPPWPGEIVDPTMAPDAIKQKKKKNCFVNKSTELVRFFPGGEYAWLSPTRVTQLSVTQIEEFVANSGHKKPELVNGYRKAAERAKDHRQIAPENLHKYGGGEGGIPHCRLGPGGPIICSDIAMTFELSVNARLFGPTTIRGDAESLLAFFQSHGGARHFEYICYAHAMLGVVEEGLGHRIGNVSPKIEGSTPLGMVFQHVGEDPRAFGHATLRGDGDAVLAFLRSQCPEQSQDICYMRLVLEEVAKDRLRDAGYKMRTPVRGAQPRMNFCFLTARLPSWNVPDGAVRLRRISAHKPDLLS
ncbi:hypothetical protein B0H13DRAFT_2285207 [Mycena leptocephala]|nr:hypothetical protein B0H13DRAFT_2285207 [Mycena leptocephala]